MNARRIGLCGRCGLTGLACLAVNRGRGAGRSLAVFFRFARVIFFLLPRLPFFPDLFEFYVMDDGQPGKVMTLRDASVEHSLGPRQGKRCGDGRLRSPALENKAHVV